MMFPDHVHVYINFVNFASVCWRAVGDISAGDSTGKD